MTEQLDQNEILDDWDQFFSSNPQLVVDKLHTLNPEACPGNKAFYSSYKTYSKFTPVQVNKTKAFFSHLDVGIKTQVINSNDLLFTHDIPNRLKSRLKMQHLCNKRMLKKES